LNSLRVQILHVCSPRNSSIAYRRTREVLNGWQKLWNVCAGDLQTAKMSGNMVRAGDVMPAKGKGKAGHSTSTFNMYQLQFLIAVGCVAYVVYVGSGMLKPSQSFTSLHTPAVQQTESRVPALQLSVSGDILASQVSFSARSCRLCRQFGCVDSCRYWSQPLRASATEFLVLANASSCRQLVPCWKHPVETI
jgi:hypothetical protein